MERNAALNNRVKITVLHLFYWIFQAMGCYQNVYLQSRGLSATVIGTLNSVISLTTIIIMPYWGLLSDRMRSVRKVFIITLAGASLLFAFIPDMLTLTQNMLPLFFLYNAATYAFLNPYKSIFENWSIRYCRDKGFSYGSVRWIGSITWCVTGLALASFISRYGTEWTFRYSSIGMILVVVLCFFTDDAAPAPQKEKTDFSFRQLFANRYYTVFLIFALFMYLVMSTYMNYIPFALKEMGLEPSLYGVLTATAALFEIPVVIGFGKTEKPSALVKSIIIGMSLFGLACFSIGTLVHTFAGYLFSVFISGIGNGLIIVNAARYVYTLVPDHMKATGQSLYTAVTAISGIISGLLAGILIDNLTAIVFYRILSGISFFSAAFLALCHVLLSNKGSIFAGKHE